MEFVAISAIATALTLSYGYASDFERYSIFTIGTYKRVERTTGTGQCIDCGSDVEEGEQRHWHQEIVFLGVPVTSYDSGSNFYCSDHASFEWRQMEQDDSEKWMEVIEIAGEIVASIDSLQPKPSSNPQLKNAATTTTATFHLVPVAFMVLFASIILGLMSSK